MSIGLSQSHQHFLNWISDRNSKGAPDVRLAFPVHALLLGPASKIHTYMWVIEIIGKQLKRCKY